MAYNFDNLTNIIYANIGKRISKQKKRLGKTRDDIYSDVELLSNIMNNHRIRNRNPYLLTNAATQNIVKNLNFSSTYQLIWGKDDDLDLILRKTFFTGLDYVNTFYNSSNNDLRHINNLLDDCLKDYLPFALHLAQSDLGEIKNIPEPLVKHIEDFDDDLSLAKEHLYWYTRDTFSELHLKYFKDAYIKKIDKKLADFYIQELPQLFKKYLNDTNYAGLKAYNVMTDIFRYEISNFNESFQSAEWLAHRPITSSGKTITEVQEKIINAGNAYIKTLIAAQKETENFPY